VTFDPKKIRKGSDRGDPLSKLEKSHHFHCAYKAFCDFVIPKQEPSLAVRILDLPPVANNSIITILKTFNS